MRYCRESGQPVAYRKADVVEVNRFNGHPASALVSCRRCRRQGLEARVCIVQVGVAPGEDGIAKMPHHYVREETA